MYCMPTRVKGYIWILCYCKVFFLKRDKASQRVNCRKLWLQIEGKPRPYRRCHHFCAIWSLFVIIVHHSNDESSLKAESCIHHDTSELPELEHRNWRYINSVCFGKLNHTSSLLVFKKEKKKNKAVNSQVWLCQYETSKLTNPSPVFSWL